MALHPELLDLVRCPRCRGRLAATGDASDPEGLRCDACRVVYPVIDGIPQLLADEARPLAGEGGA